MKYLSILFLVLCTSAAAGQSIRELHPTLGYLVDKSPEGERAFNTEKEKCVEVWKKLSDENDHVKLSSEEKATLENCSEETESYWEILGAGCSWYCGGGQDTLSASSALKSNRGITYSAKNIHDLRYETAWVEGVPGYGIGEFVTFHIPPQNPRITEIIIVNGYVKSLDAWKNNSRVKKLRMYINDKPFAILNVSDTRQEQHFTFEPLGYSDRDNWDLLQTQPWWTIKFEILDVYKGDRYDDTAITEIYFDGIDVH